MKSPAPFYNFATIPVVHARDQYWVTKDGGVKSERTYEDILLPKNTGLGVLIAACAFMFGFGVIWHIVWMMAIGVLGVIASVTHRAFLEDDDTEYTLTAHEVRALESL